MRLYIILVHVILALVVVKSDFLARVGKRLGLTQASGPEITDYFRSILVTHERMDATVPEGAVVFIGDSHTQGLCVDTVTTPSVNFGIGGDTTVGVLNRLGKYHCLERASVVVLAVGINDMRWRDNTEIVENYNRILKALPPKLPVVVNALFPVDAPTVENGNPQITNARIHDLNQALRGLCAAHPRCVFADAGAKLADQTGNLQKALQYRGDGIHLNSDGYRLWIDTLRNAIAEAKGISSHYFAYRSAR